MKQLFKELLESVRIYIYKLFSKQPIMKNVTVETILSGLDKANELCKEITEKTKNQKDTVKNINSKRKAKK